MEKFVSRGREANKRSPQLQREGKKQAPKMALEAQRATRSSMAGTVSAPEEESRENVIEEVIQPEPGWSCKELAVEVAKILAPDIKAALEVTVASTLTQLQSDVSAHSKQINELENRMEMMEEDLKGTQSQVEKLLKNNDFLRDKVDDLENRSRRNNLRMVGLPENIMLSQLIQICASELPQALGLSGSFVVERAHRVGPAPRMMGESRENKTRPRQVIIKFLNYAEKTLLLQTFKKTKGEVSLRGQRILLFNDFSAEVARKRRAYAAVCTDLVKKQRRFFLQFPATLRVFRDDGSFEIFHSPEEAMESLQTTGGNDRNAGAVRKKNKMEKQRISPLAGD